MEKNLHKAELGGIMYFAKVIGNKLLIEKHSGSEWEKRVFKIAEASEGGITYCIQKTQVKSSAGAEGIADFLDRAWENYKFIFINKVWENCKPVKG